MTGRTGGGRSEDLHGLIEEAGGERAGERDRHIPEKDRRPDQGVAAIAAGMLVTAPAVRKASAAPGIMPMFISSPTRRIAVYTRSCHVSYKSKFPEFSNKLGK